jgi:hypothetical protein
MAVNRRLLKERLNLDPGLNGKTKPREKNHLKLFWKDSQDALKRQAGHNPAKTQPFSQSPLNVTLLNLENFLEAKLGIGIRVLTEWERGPRLRNLFRSKPGTQGAIHEGNVERNPGSNRAWSFFRFPFIGWRVAIRVRQPSGHEQV